jgi:hypothetical protein
MPTPAPPNRNTSAESPAAVPADRCPRCGGGFHCGAGGLGPCACAAVTLSAELQRTLRERYSGCLCLACLVALAQPGAMP